MPLAGTSTVPVAVLASYGTSGAACPTVISIGSLLTGVHTLPSASVMSCGV